MQVNTIGANLAQTRNGQHFTGKRENIDAFIGLDDQTIRRAATLKTLASIDTEKHKKLDRALDCALPIAGGISAAAVAEKGTRLAAFGFGFANWALFLAGMGMAFGIEKAVRNRSEKVDNFAQKHPVMTFIATAATAFTAGILAIKGGAKGLEALSKTNFYKNASQKAGELIGRVKANKTVEKVTQKVNGWIAKTPSALKEAGKTAASWATWATIIGSIAHSANHKTKVANEYAKNYTELKEKQLDLAKRRNVELAVKNDFLMTNPQNREDVEIIDALINGPIEV